MKLALGNGLWEERERNADKHSIGNRTILSAAIKTSVLGNIVHHYLSLGRGGSRPVVREDDRDPGLRYKLSKIAFCVVH